MKTIVGHHCRGNRRRVATQPRASGIGVRPILSCVVAGLLAWGVFPAVSAVAADPTVVLVASSPENLTAQGLDALGIEHRRVSLREFRDFSTLDADLLIWGFDESREALAPRQEEMAAFLRAGGVFLGFRSSGEDAWLPVPAAHDKAYAFGEILCPEHAIFTQPHALSEKELAQVHGGSVYRAFRGLGPGWIPLCSTGAEQAWDKTSPGGDGPCYGLIELPLGEGRLILCQMIPEYAWFRDAEGDRETPGAKLFETLVRYALANAPSRAADRPPRVAPESFRGDLADVVVTPGRRSGVPLTEPAWKYQSSGPYRWKVDRRGVLTFTHADEPSTAGNFAQLSGSLAVPPDTNSLVLRWYKTDTYCGGREVQLGGKDHGQLALENYKREMRFAQVLVNGEVVWENDVCGPNPQPARRAVHYADVTELVRKAGRCDVVLRVEDRKGSGEEPFAIDVFFAAVDLLTNLQLKPVADMKSEGFTVEAQAKRLAADKGVLETQYDGPNGRFALAVCLTDGFEGRSKLKLLAAGKPLADWTLSADDGATWWAVAPPAELRTGDQLQVEITREGQESPCVAQLAVIAPELLAKPVAEAARVVHRGEVTEQVRFAVTVPETSGLARTDEVATAGLPFPRGCLTEEANVRVLDDGGQPVPCQFRPVGRWSDGSARTTVVAFPANVGADALARYTIEAGKNVTPGPEGALQLSEEADRICIDTGPLQAVFSKRKGTVVETLGRGAEVVKPAEAAWELVVGTEEGRTLRSGGETVSSVRIVERGPVRALLVRTGSLADEAGKQLDYRMTTELTAGSDLLRVEVSIVNREDQPEVYIKRWSLDFPVAGAETGRVDLGDRWCAANDGAVLYQHREDRLTWTGADAECSRVEGKASGWVRLPGLVIGPRWFWQRFPQAVQFSPDKVRFDLLPEAFDSGDLPTRWRDRLLEMTDRFTVGGVGYPQSPGKMGLFRLTRGEALSQEFGIVADGAAVDAPPVGRERLVTPLRPVAEPAYTASTGAFGALVPRDPERLERYEQLVDRCYEGYLAQRRKRREYGFENFGDSTFEWGYGPSYTYWSNSEYDHHHGFGLQYLRSGDPRWWELCETAARQYRDVVVVHDASDESGMRGGPHHHNATNLWMPQHEEQFWIADHTLHGCHVSHSWVEGLILYAWVSGDPWAEEVIDEMAGWYVRMVERNQFGAGGQERGPGWTLIALSALAEATQDEQVIAAGGTVAEWLLEHQDPIRGVVSVPISEQRSYEGGSTFMHGIVGRGLGRWCDVTGDPRVKNATIGIAEWIITEPMGEPGMFWYKQSPQNSTRYRPTDQVLTALSYAYTLSEDPRFADVAVALIDKTGPNVRSMSWHGQSLKHLWPLLKDKPAP